MDNSSKRHGGGSCSCCSDGVDETDMLLDAFSGWRVDRVDRTLLDNDQCVLTFQLSVPGVKTTRIIEIFYSEGISFDVNDFDDGDNDVENSNDSS